jgi:hypothetical protein
MARRFAWKFLDISLKSGEFTPRAGRRRAVGVFRAATRGELAQRRKVLDLALAILALQIALKRGWIEDLADQWPDRTLGLIESVVDEG